MKNRKKQYKKYKKFMTTKDILAKIEEIKRLEEVKGEPFKGVKRKGLRSQLLPEVLGKPGNLLKVGDYVLRIAFIEKDMKRPYVQIYTKESYQKYLEFYELKEAGKNGKN